MADLTEIDEELCESSTWDFSDLRALYVNCTLKRSPEVSNTQGLADRSIAIMRRNGVAVDVIRAVARRAVSVAELPETDGAPAADHRDLDLTDALIRLPPKQRQAVAYHYLAGLPYADVAAVLGGSADAARRAAADGVATLRRTYPGRNARRGEPR